MNDIFEPFGAIFRELRNEINILFSGPTNPKEDTPVPSEQYEQGEWPKKDDPDPPAEKPDPIAPRNESLPFFCTACRNLDSGCRECRHLR